jgi:hypothetical protein
MKYLSFVCPCCDANYSVEYDEVVIDDDTPIFCPFCSEEIEELDLDEDFVNDDED